MRRLILSTLAVVGLASPASADGGWVLWMMGGDSPWDSVSTFATREECAVAMHQQAQALEKMGLRVSEEPGASFNGADADRTMRGQCLAENADPRARGGSTGWSRAHSRAAGAENARWRRYYPSSQTGISLPLRPY